MIGDERLTVETALRFPLTHSLVPIERVCVPKMANRRRPVARDRGLDANLPLLGSC